MSRIDEYFVKNIPMKEEKMIFLNVSHIRRGDDYVSKYYSYNGEDSFVNIIPISEGEDCIIKACIIALLFYCYIILLSDL